MSTSSHRQLAVVTGASSGIGLELAKQFATHGYDLVVAAEDAELDSATRELEALGTQVEAVRADLATEEGVRALHGRLAAAGRPVDAAALNAGVGLGRAFVDQTPEDILRVIDVNVRGTALLARLVGGDMVARGEGRILFTSSIASTQPGAFQAVYNASKSFVQSLAVALREEFKETGVTVTSLMPGPVETEFFERAGMTDTKVGSDDKDDPADVARDGFEALIDGKERVVSHSLSSKALGRAGRVLPDNAKAAMHRRMAEPGSGDDD